MYFVQRTKCRCKFFRPVVITVRLCSVSRFASLSFYLIPFLSLIFHLYVVSALRQPQREKMSLIFRFFCLMGCLLYIRVCDGLIDSCKSVRTLQTEDAPINMSM